MKRTWECVGQRPRLGCQPEVLRAPLRPSQSWRCQRGMSCRSRSGPRSGSDKMLPDVKRTLLPWSDLRAQGRDRCHSSRFPWLSWTRWRSGSGWSCRCRELARIAWQFCQIYRAPKVLTKFWLMNMLGHTIILFLCEHSFKTHVFVVPIHLFYIDTMYLKSYYILPIYGFFSFYELWSCALFRTCATPMEVAFEPVLLAAWQISHILRTHIYLESIGGFRLLLNDQVDGGVVTAEGVSRDAREQGRVASLRSLDADCREDAIGLDLLTNGVPKRLWIGQLSILLTRYQLDYGRYSQ